MASSSRTVQAFVSEGEFTPESRKHPAVAFIEKTRAFFDGRDLTNSADFHSEDFTIFTPQAKEMSHPPEHAESDQHSVVRAIIKFYGDPLDEHRHVLYDIIVFDSEDGYNVHTRWYMYANLPGTPAEGEEKVVDEMGREWDLLIPTYYHFTIVKEPNSKHGMRISHVRFIKDTGAVNDVLEKRGQHHKSWLKSAIK